MGNQAAAVSTFYKTHFKGIRNDQSQWMRVLFNKKFSSPDPLKISTLLNEIKKANKKPSDFIAGLETDLVQIQDLDSEIRSRPRSALAVLRGKYVITKDGEEKLRYETKESVVDLYVKASTSDELTDTKWQKCKREITKVQDFLTKYEKNTLMSGFLAHNLGTKSFEFKK